MHWHSPFTARRFAELHKEWGRPHALGRILGLVESHGCETLAIEPRPRDPEFTDELNLLRRAKRLRKDSPTYATRLHFFQGRVDGLWAVEDNDPRYLGYCDLRPKSYIRSSDDSEHGTVSEALISSATFVPAQTRHLYLICQRNFPVRLAGRRLSVRAFPYVQQDGHVVNCGACAMSTIAQYYGIAQTATWFENTAARMQYGAGAITTPPRRLMGAQALHDTLLKAGLHPLMHDYDNKPDPQEGARQQSTPEQVAHRYVQSGIPVLIGLDAGSGPMHAVVAIGHTFSPDSWMQRAGRTYFANSHIKPGAYQPSTAWMEQLIVQDDNMGPYTLMPTTVLRRRDVLRKGARKPVLVVPLQQPMPLRAGKVAEWFVGNFIDPRVEKFALLLEAIMEQAANSARPLPDESRFWFDQLRHHIQRGEVVLRTVLQSAEQWRQRAMRSPNRRFLMPLLKQLRLPKWVWVVELSWPSAFLHCRRAAGEVVLDPEHPLNQSVKRRSQSWLWMHLPGLVAFRDRKSGDIGYESLLDHAEYPLPHYVGNGVGNGGFAAATM